MDEFPGNSKRVPRSRNEEPKKVERVVQGDVVRRKIPLGRRMTQNLIGGDAHSVWGYVFGEVLIPAARDTIADAVSGGVERMIFGDSSAASRRGRSRGGPAGHVPYNRMSGGNNRPRDDRREMSHRGRANHSFEEIILQTRAEAEEVLDRLEDLLDRYDDVSVSDLYQMVGITGNYTDNKWGWTDLRGAGVSRIRTGYLLDLPRPEPLA